VPSARRGDDEYRTTFPGFDIRRNPHRPDTLRNYFHSASAPFPERGYRGGAIQRYVNPELDTLIDLHDATVSKPDRWQILGQIVHLITDQVVVIGLFYDVDVTVQTSRMKNVLTRADQRGEAWNVHEWDVAN
jgi:ABC-type transport system substrate-binding protein